MCTHTKNTWEHYHGKCLWYLSLICLKAVFPIGQSPNRHQIGIPSQNESVMSRYWKDGLCYVGSLFIYVIDTPAIFFWSHMLSVLANKINMRNPIFLTVVQICSEVYHAYASVKDIFIMFCHIKLITPAIFTFCSHAVIACAKICSHLIARNDITKKQFLRNLS